MQVIIAIILLYLAYLLIRYVVIPLVIIVVTFSATAAFFIAAALAVVGAGIGCVVSLHSFIKAVRGNLTNRRKPTGSPVTGKKIEEHSHEQYFYWNGDWRHNLNAIIRDTVRGNWEYVVKCWEWVTAQKGWKGWVVFKFCAGVPACISIVAGAFIFLPIFFVPYILITAFMWILVNLASFEMHWLERIFLKIHGLSLTCPECSHRVNLPVYRCPSCQKEQKRLIPTNRYGAIYRICACGEHLPTSRFFGRNQLPAYCDFEEERTDSSGVRRIERCREKSKPLDKHSQNVKPATIMFLGGTNSGKTTLYKTILSMLLKGYQLEDGTTAPPLYQSPPRKWERRLNHEFLQRLEGPNGIHHAYRTSYSRTTQKDDNEMLKAFCVDLRKPRWKFYRRLYIYDVAGEYFDKMEELKKMKYYGHLRAASVLVVDPFAIPEFMAEYKSDGGNLPDEQISTMLPMDALNLWQNTMKNHFPGIAKQFCCAIVINKTDAPRFNEVSGLSPGATDTKCRDFLKDYGMANLLQMAKDNFQEHQCFAVSIAPGQSAGQEPCPAGLEKVIDWLLSKTATQ